MTNSVGFVLVKPQLPENIGFCARALKNFGFKKLHLVKPKEKWPNKKAIATAVAAQDILNKLKFIQASRKLFKLMILYMLLQQEKETPTKNIFHLKNLLQVLKKIKKRKLAYYLGLKLQGYQMKI